MTTDERDIGTKRRRGFRARPARGSEHSSDVSDSLLDRPARKPARHRIMDIIARRDHSELEIRRKLETAEYSSEEIDDAIEFAKESRWLAAPPELARRVATTLDRKRKGHRFINQFLKAKGLPPVEKDAETEIEKGRALVRSKLGSKLEGKYEGELAKGIRIDYEDRKKIHRLLANRGFDDETIRAVIESLKKPAL